MTIIIGHCFKCGRDDAQFRPKNKTTCRDCVLERERLWRKSHRHKLVEYDARKVISAAYKTRTTSLEYREKARKVSAVRRAKAVAKDRSVVLQKDRAKKLKSVYGLSEADYEALLEKQNGRCAICKRLPGQKKLAVDHDHKTGKIRGLLCGPCNGSLGLFKESIELLEKAALYLGRFS